jgi:hypothetical protein
MTRRGDEGSNEPADCEGVETASCGAREGVEKMAEWKGGDNSHEGEGETKGKMGRDEEMGGKWKGEGDG